MEDPGPPGGREVQPDGVGLSHFYGRGEAVAGRGGASTVPSHTRLHGAHRRGVGGRAALSFVFFLLFTALVRLLFLHNSTISLVRFTTSWDRPGLGAKGSLQRAATVRTSDRCRTVHNFDVV